MRGIRVGASSLPIAATMLAAVALVVLPLAPRAGSGTPPGAATSLAPVSISSVPTKLADGSSYALRYVLDSRHTVGVSMTTDGSAFRLVQLVDGNDVKELRSLPTSSGPQYDGFAFADGLLYWVETTIDTRGYARSGLWSASVKDGDASSGERRRVLSDMGQVVFYDSPFDLIVADGVISWTTPADVLGPGTLLRSMPVGGGPISERGYGSPWRQTSRPWLVSAASGTMALLNTDTGQLLNVASTGAEGVSCGAEWCRFTIASTDGPVRLDLVRPDGSQRTRVAGANTLFEALDPAMLGRYEILSQTGDDLADGDQRLLIYDIEKATTRLIEVGMAALVTNRGTYAWWLSGDIKSPTWHVLDLRALD